MEISILDAYLITGNCHKSYMNAPATGDETPAGVSSSSFYPSPPHHRFPPPSSHHHGPCTRDNAQHRRDETPAGVSSSSLRQPPPLPSLLSTPPRASRLVRYKPVHARRRQRDETPAGVSSSSLRPPPPLSSLLSTPPCARCLACAHETTTTGRDAGRRLVLILSLHPQPPFPSRRAGAQIPPDSYPQRTTTPQARRLARCEPVHAGRQRRNETPAGASLLSLSPCRRRVLPSSTLSTPPGPAISRAL
ncbi:hypothetical protein PLICRDRAFT_702051 [Plicaturopsis crispa FD-325 SS-3]|uniref:Uncharacterized protein n=1 Tax=Plicaturopsis crispa FD-325 SS-3 TaxID=944288 RepID=A0A0C9T452_PLICR|nr:hypothetical protein PLICRDRAFT_702051 [Plicaturopsis crispa FD-325 SS-3]